jgi:hypothetical protein
MSININIDINTGIMKRIMLALGIAVALFIATPIAVEAHKGHDHLLMGTLTMVAPDHVMVKVTDPKTKQDSVKTIKMTPATKILKGTPATAAKTAELTAGIRIVVNVGEGKEPLAAKEIRIGAAPAPGTK